MNVGTDGPLTRGRRKAMQSSVTPVPGAHSRPLRPKFMPTLQLKDLIHLEHNAVCNISASVCLSVCVALEAASLLEGIETAVPPVPIAPPCLSQLGH